MVVVDCCGTCVVVVTSYLATEYQCLPSTVCNPVIVTFLPIRDGLREHNLGGPECFGGVKSLSLSVSMIVAGNTSVVTSEREGIINNQETSFSIKDELIQESVLMPIFLNLPHH